MEAMNIANKMIKVYESTPVEKYPQARAIDVLDELDFNDRNRLQAMNLFMAWLDLKEQE